MAVAAEFEALTDPVCGRAVGIGSAFRFVHRGALFCFCSAPCRDRFIADPQGVLALPGHGRAAAPVAAAAPVPPIAAAAAQPPPIAATRGPGRTLATLDPWTLPLDLPALAPPPASAPPRALPARGAPGTGGSVFAFLVPLQQRRFARRVSRELLALYHAQRARGGALPARDLYREIVSVRMRVDVVGAEALLDRAEESFASWPTPRALTFNDVVHLIVILEFRATYGGTPWIRANLAQVVTGEIPHHL